MSSAAPQRRTSTARPATRVAVGQAVEQVRLRVVPRLPRLRSRAPRMPFVGLVSLLLLGGVVGLLLFNTSMQQASFTQTALESRADDLQARRQALATEVERLRDPQLLAREARQQGMVPAPDSSYLELDGGTISGPLTPATREDDIRFPPDRVPRPDELDPVAPVVPARDTSDRAQDQHKSQKRDHKQDQKQDQRRGRKSNDQGSGAPRGDQGGSAHDGRRGR